MGNSPHVTPRGRVTAARHIRATGPPAKVHRLRQHRGTPARLDAAYTREHIRILLAYGLTYKAIARPAGVTQSTIAKILNSPDGRLIDFRTQAAILSVTWEPHPAQSVCLAVGATRRAHALARIGWPITWQAAQVGMQHGSYQGRLRGRRISYDIWAAIRDLYDRYSGTPGPSARARKAAVGYRWAPPLAWDDDQIDNPTAKPAATPVPDIPLTTARRLARMAEVRRLTAQGLTTQVIAEKLGVSVWTVNRDNMALREAA